MSRVISLDIVIHHDMNTLYSRNDLNVFAIHLPSRNTILAVYKGYTDCVKLLGPFSDVNKLCYAPITRKGTMHNVDDSNAPGKKSSSLLQPPLVLASSHGYTDIVVTLLHLQADPNLADVRGNTALVVAAEEGHLEVVEILMTQDVDVKIRSKVGKVAIHKARKNKHIEIVDYLENFILR